MNLENNFFLRKCFLFFLSFFLFSSFLIGQDKKKFNWFDWVDFNIGFSLDFAYTQTPLHYLSYLSDKENLSNPFNSLLADANKTVSSGIGYGILADLGMKLKPLSPLSLGVEYQFSVAGTSANNLTYLDSEGESYPLYLTAGYLDHRARVYFKVSPKVNPKVFLSATFFVGLAVIDLGNFSYTLDSGDFYTYLPLKDLTYQNGQLVFNRTGVYYGFDLGFRLSLYVINATFDLAITPKFIIPRFSLAFTVNDDLIRLIK